MMNSEFNPGFLGMACSHGFWRSAGEHAAQFGGRSPTSSKVRSRIDGTGRSRAKSRSSRSRAARAQNRRGVSKRTQRARVWRRLQLYSATLRGLKIGRSVFAAAAVGLDVEG